MLDEFDFRSEMIVLVRDFEKKARELEMEKATFEEWFDWFIEDTRDKKGISLG